MAASLTGGNALATLVRMIQLWCMELGCNVPQVMIVTSDSVKIETTGENLEHCTVCRDEGDGGAEPSDPAHHLRGAALPRPEGLRL